MFIPDLLPILICVFGAYMLCKLRFFLLLHPLSTAKRILRLVGNEKSRRSLFLALAGTLGVGNIVGVAYGISVGGAGCVFWIFLSGLFSSVIKYGESLLAADSKGDGAGGIPHALVKSFGRAGYILGCAYGMLCILLSFVMGGALQSGSFASSLKSSIGIPESISSMLFGILVFITVFGGAEMIGKVTAFIIPLSTIVYIVVCVAVLVNHIGSLPQALKLIVRDAFDFKSMTGGVSAFFISKSVKEGFSRGLLSNEAGAGTSSMAQSRSDMPPSDVGLLGVTEVFFDTTLLCTLTGVCVVVCRAAVDSGDGVGIILSVFSALLGKYGAYLLSFMILAFAHSSSVCWYYYGTECMGFLFGKKKSTVYTVLFALSGALGYLIPEAFLMPCCDYLLFFMSLLTLFVLLKNSERIVFLSEIGGLLKKSDSRKRRESERIHLCDL